MPSQVLTSVENNFTKGLITESTGLNFPENAATDTDNCAYTLVGDVLRRQGIDFETNFATHAVVKAGKAISTYKWDNAGGDGNTKLIVNQIGSILTFYNVSTSSTSTPLSTQLLASSIDLSTFVAAGDMFDATVEATYSSGNGYLFIFHPSCEPTYYTYVSGVITGNIITVQIRDFVGIPENIPDNLRPSVLNNVHQYNLQNQGWTSGTPWSVTSTTTLTVGNGVKVFTIPSGLTITAGQAVTVIGSRAVGFPFLDPSVTMTGTVTSYSGTTLTLAISSFTPASPSITSNFWSISPFATGYLNTWFSAIGNYPSNADQWWSFKTAAGVFDPTNTIANTSIGTGAAPKGHNIINAFQQFRTAQSGIAGLTDITTLSRPTNGAWFQGRVWYTGVSASFAATGTAPATTWTETIYFSQIVFDPSDFGQCCQKNDPTSELLFDLLPTDGGTIVIQGSGTIYKLFPIQNGMLVFAANGVWFITGSQGIGFSANDYTITKLSNVESISTTSFVDVMGLPYFWNEEGIYQVTPQQQGGLTVNPITVGTILTFYNSIPKQSKKYVRGAYHTIDYVIQWIYKSSNETSVTDRYTFDKILNYNVYNKAFFPYTIDTVQASINGINFVQGPGGSNTPDPVFKYIATTSSAVTFADEHDVNFVDWATAGTAVNYVSFFVTGYKLHGQAQRRFQMPYIYVYNRMSGTSLGYNIQGIWDYAAERNSNRWSVPQTVLISKGRFNNVFKRHRIRGQGLVLQIKVYSIDGQPFDIMGWSVLESQNLGV